jgi:hypothetical protein
VVSLIFVVACIVRSLNNVSKLFSCLCALRQGFISGALANLPLSEKLGFGKVGILYLEDLYLLMNTSPVSCYRFFSHLNIQRRRYEF